MFSSRGAVGAEGAEDADTKDEAAYLGLPLFPPKLLTHLQAARGVSADASDVPASSAGAEWAQTARPTRAQPQAHAHTLALHQAWRLPGPHHPPTGPATPSWTQTELGSEASWKTGRLTAELL